LKKHNTAETTNDFRGCNKGSGTGPTGNKKRFLFFYLFWCATRKEKWTVGMEFDAGRSGCRGAHGDNEKLVRQVTEVSDPSFENRSWCWCSTMGQIFGR
jgi:hypothetical protein